MYWRTMTINGHSYAVPTDHDFNECDCDHCIVAETAQGMPGCHLAVQDGQVVCIEHGWTVMVYPGGAQHEARTTEWHDQRVQVRRS